MEVILSNRMEAFKPSIFSELAAYKRKKLEEGCSIIDLSIGSPDMPPPAFVTDILANTAGNGNEYGYSLTGTEELHKAIATYYTSTYGATLQQSQEILMLMGSQDGLVHLPMVFANPGDYILVPDPGYTAYATGIAMAGAVPYLMPLQKKNGFLPNLSLIPEDAAERAKLMILNFPGNPVPAMANEAFFSEVIAFAKKYNIIVVHDFAYGELYFEGKKPISFLSVSGAKDVGIEINSLSKSFNMAGCRIGYAIGNEKIIAALGQLKSNLDYGVFYPIQQAAAKALQEGAQFCEESRRMYERRRDILIDGLEALGWKVDKPAGSMFIWAEIPNRWNSLDFAYALIDRANVVVTPGHAFGPSGEGFVRIALVQTEDKLRLALRNIQKSGIFG